MNRPKPLLPLKSTCVYKCTTSFLFEFIETTTTKKKKSLYFGECRFFFSTTYADELKWLQS